MSNNKNRLKEKEITDIAHKIGKEAFRKITRLFRQEFRRLENAENIHPDDFANIIILSMVNIDINVLIQLRNVYIERCEKELDFEELMSAYHNNLMRGMVADDLKRKREKMN